MSPENETELIKKVNSIHRHLIGDPFSSPPMPGMISEHAENCTAIKNLNEKVEKVEKWREKFRLRLAMVIGVLVGAVEGIKQLIIGFVDGISGK
jgi:hypothetical protein